MINFAFTLIVLFWNKRQITIGTIVTMVLISLFVDWIGSITTIMDAVRSLPKYIHLFAEIYSLEPELVFMSLQTFVQHRKKLSF